MIGLTSGDMRASLRGGRAARERRPIVAEAAGGRTASSRGKSQGGKVTKSADQVRRCAMGQLVVDAAMRAKLAQVTERVEVRDESGALLGDFIPKTAAEPL